VLAGGGLCRFLMQAGGGSNGAAARRGGGGSRQAGRRGRPRQRGTGYQWHDPDREVRQKRWHAGGGQVNNAR